MGIYREKFIEHAVRDNGTCLIVHGNRYRKKTFCRIQSGKIELNTLIHITLFNLLFIDFKGTGADTTDQLQMFPYSGGKRFVKTFLKDGTKFGSTLRHRYNLRHKTFTYIVRHSNFTVDGSFFNILHDHAPVIFNVAQNFSGKADKGTGNLDKVGSGEAESCLKISGIRVSGRENSFNRCG